MKLNVPVLGTCIAHSIQVPNNLWTVAFIVQTDDRHIYRLIKVKGKKGLFYIFHSIPMRDRKGKRYYKVVYYICLASSFDQTILKTVLQNNIHTAKDE